MNILEGRWEFVLHNGNSKGEGGTTSGVTIIGYGTTGSASSVVGTDSSFLRVPSTTILQVDFGDIGELLKVRLEVDGTGEQPEFYLEYVEMRDLDTDERLVVRVGKWFFANPSGKKRKRAQSFREFSVFRAGAEPLLMNMYEGTVEGGDMSLLASRKLYGQLVGELSDGGVFPLVYSKKSKEYTYKAECVSLGRLIGMRVFGDFTDFGKEVMEGFATLQQLYEKRELAQVTVANHQVASRARVRESTHTPFEYLLAGGRVHDLEEVGGPQYKLLVVEKMVARETICDKMREQVDEDQWRISLSLKEPTETVPTVLLIQKLKEYEMVHDATEEGDKAERLVLKYKLDCPPIGRVDKMRISVDPSEKPPNISILKIRLVNAANGDEIRYPYAESDFETASSVEFPAVYPDVQPLSS